MCRTCTRAPVSCAIRTSRCVQVSATSGERQTGWLAGSPVTRKPIRSRSMPSSSEWKAARRRVWRRMAATPSSSSTSRLPVDEPMKTLMPAAPGRRSSSGMSFTFSCVPPTQKAKSQCMRCRPRAILSASAASLVVSGLVFGISKTQVTPPSTAAREPVSRSSLWSSPGSRKCTCESITPGRMCSPVQSTTSPAEARERSPSAMILPPVMPRSRCTRPSWFTTVPPLRITSNICGMAGLPVGLR